MWDWPKLIKACPADKQIEAAGEPARLSDEGATGEPDSRKEKSDAGLAKV